MSIPFSPEQLVCIRDDARHLAAKAMDHDPDVVLAAVQNVTAV